MRAFIQGALVGASTLAGGGSVAILYRVLFHGDDMLMEFTGSALALLLSALALAWMEMAEYDRDLRERLEALR